jgi:tetratricopeptide (TPR) repeat protein
VHRDDTPSTAFVRRDGSALLLDFGIAARAEDSRLTATATTLGTPWYMAPEQARGGAAAAATLDVYGLGASLYHLLAGRPPYQGEPAAVLAALQQRDPAPLRSVCPELPRDLAAVVERAMERDPRRRYADGAALAADLGAFLEHRAVVARPIGPLARRWRAARRHPARTLAIGAGLVLAIVLPLYVAQAAGAAREEAAQRRLQRLRQLDAQLPSLLAVEGQPDQRLVEVLLPDQQEAVQLLDDMLDLDQQQLPARLFRAAMRLDAGDHKGAAADLQAIASAQSSRYLTALAQRYQAVAPGARGTEAVDVAGLPPPDGVAARFVAGVHELRNRQVSGFAERADALLAAAAPSYVPARDLRLIALLARTDTEKGDARAALFQAAYDEALQLEQVYGQQTARTRFVIGAALLGQKRYEDAIAPLQQSLRLRPDRHGPLINLGIALRRVGRLDEAIDNLQRAHALRPAYWNTVFTLAQVERDRGDFAAANRWAELVPGEGNGLEWKQPELVASIALAEAVAARGGDPAPMRAAADRAALAFDRALAAAPSELRRRLELPAQAAAALRAADLEGAARAFLELLQTDPANPYQLANLANMLPPTGLDAAATVRLGVWLRRLASALAPGDASLRVRMAAEIERLQGKATPGGR